MTNLMIEIMMAKECINKHPDTFLDTKEFLYVNEK